VAATKIISPNRLDVRNALQAVTDLRIGQIGHGLGPRAFEGPTQLFLMMTQC